MKKLILAGLTSLVVLSGVALAEQTGEQKRSSSMQGMMQQMMGGETAGRGMGGGMEGMMGMMRMMGQMGQMMDQCVAMMDEHQPTKAADKSKG